MWGVNPVTIFFMLVVALWLMNSINVLREYERGVIFRLGRLLPQPKGPGLIFVFWPIDRIVRVSLRTVALDVPTQDIITSDNVSVKVNAVVYFRVLNATKAIVEVENYLYATSQLSQTTLRSVLGEVMLDDLLSQRETLNMKLQALLDKQTDPWGIKVSLVEVKAVDLPQEMQRAMAKQAEAERERRAKVINAEGEFQASAKIAEASEVLSANPVSLQLRFLQTMHDMASNERASTIILPLPIDVLTAFMKKGEKTDS
jgi:regulator of protease activity HflC (stomatin/prohibitin superfamily)